VPQGALRQLGWRRKRKQEVQICAFNVLALEGEDLRDLPLTLRKTNLARLLARRPDGIVAAPFEQGEIGPDLFLAACNMGRLHTTKTAGLSHAREHGELYYGVA
jgi:ATP-dependent DNA ligase